MQIPIPSSQAMTWGADCGLRLTPSPSPDFAVLARAMDIQLMVMLLDCYKGLLCQIVGSNLLSASVFCVQQPVAKEFIRFQDCGGERAAAASVEGYGAAIHVIYWDDISVGP